MSMPLDMDVNAIRCKKRTTSTRKWTVCNLTELKEPYHGKSKCNQFVNLWISPSQCATNAQTMHQ
eukprot:7053568-Lingulodinium_polyedra.AAC.1